MFSMAMGGRVSVRVRVRFRVGVRVRVGLEEVFVG